ncbi:hypothetical protein HDU98_009875 [Podochytrium sp. JEL0797]|nr:hypothetical protein HDU98_009875 [Podochytrium sp. JEL0797]
MFPQVAPLRPHKGVKDATDTLTTLLHATHPVLNPDRTQDFSKVQLLRRTNPIVVDDEIVLADLAFNIRDLVQQYPVLYRHSDIKRRALKEKIQPNGAKEYDETEFLRTTRLAPAVLPVHLQLSNTCRHTYTRILTRDDGVLNGDGSKHSGDTSHCADHNGIEWPLEYSEIPKSVSAPHIETTTTCTPILTKVETIRKFSSYDNEHTRAHPENFIVEWYVSFTDQEVFAFNDTPRFASEEIKALENPVLGSLSECMKELSKRGVLHTRTMGDCVAEVWKHGRNANLNFGKSPLIHDDIHFHLPKHKQEHDFRSTEIAPISRDPAGLCTPILLQGVPKLAGIDPGALYGKQLDGGTEEVSKVERTFETLQKGITAFPKGMRPANNLICMSAPDRLANPLRPKTGPYTIYQLRQIFRTAYTAFRGAVLKAKETHECLKEENPVVRRSGSEVTLDMDEKADDVMVSISQRFVPGKLEVVVHTGDWGTGEFDNNPVVMAYLQIAAAFATGVDHLYYHILGKSMHVEEALVILRSVWKMDAGGSAKIEVMKLLEGLEEKKFEWGMNGYEAKP